MTSQTDDRQIVTWTRRDGVLVVTIDNPPVNAASAAMRAGLEAALIEAQVDDRIRAVVLTGTGRNFVGGADITEFGQPLRDPSLPQLVARIESSDKPVIAAINGAALGGGCEIALACHARIALTGSRIGLPEVKLGLVPGAGGTQRLPRLIGLPAAIDWIASGRPATADQAHKVGLVDRLVDDRDSTDGLVAQAISFAQGLVGQPLRRTGELPVPPCPTDAIEQAAAKALAKIGGQAAPAEAVALARLAAVRALADGLAEERRVFIALRDSPQSAALRHVFFAERASAKVAGLADVAPRPVKVIGVVGTGLMGAGIAMAALDAGYRVIGVERTDEAAAAGQARIQALIDRAVKTAKIDEAGRQDRLDRLSVARDARALAPADLVIEAVFDDLAVKTALLVELDAIVRQDAILATNTSYLDPDQLAAATAHPERLVGLHFFSPANVMRLVEVVRCARTAPDVLATGIAVAKKLGKLPIVTGACEGFIGNRIFSAYRSEAEFLLEDGALPAEIDAAIEHYGFPMGPFAVFDMAGLEIAWARRKRQAATRDAKARYVDIADRLCECGRFGRKSGAGWYGYPDGQRTVDPVVTAMIEAARSAKSITPRSIGEDEIVSRLLAAMAAEGRKILGDGIAERPGDIDLVMINGYGFPAYKGGPMFVSQSGEKP